MDNKKDTNTNDKYDKVDKSEKIYFEEGENYNLPKESDVTVIDCGNKIIIQNSWKISNNLKKYIRQDQEHYIDIETGELKEYSENGPYKTMKEISKTSKDLRELCLKNFNGRLNELFITLTCDHEVKDIKTIKKYARYFIRRLKKKYPKKNFEYIYKYERQENQNWHFHLLLKDTKHKHLYIPNEKIEKIWNKGFTKTQRVYDGSSTEQRKTSPEDEEDLSEEETTINDALKGINVTNKAGIANYMSKKNQLKNFPRGEKIYIKSQGIEDITKIKMKYGEAIEHLIQNNFHITDEKTILIKSSSNDNIINRHKIEEYRKL